MIKYALGTLAAVMVASIAQAAAPTPAEIVSRHMAAAGSRDVNAIVADYADDAVVLQAGTAVQGKAAIRALFERMFPASPPPGGAAGPLAGIKVTKVWQEGNVGFVTWTAGPVNGTDEFLVRDGKIAVQSVFISGAPPAAR